MDESSHIPASIEVSKRSLTKARCKPSVLEVSGQSKTSAPSCKPSFLARREPKQRHDSQAHLCTLIFATASSALHTFREIAPEFTNTPCLKVKMIKPLIVLSFCRPCHYIYTYFALHYVIYIFATSLATIPDLFTLPFV